MYVVKRDGSHESINFNKISARLKRLCYSLNKTVDYNKVAQKVIEGLKDGITTTEIDDLAAQTSASMASIHPDYSILASRISITNLHKNTDKSFFKVIDDLYNYIDPKTKQNASLIDEVSYNIILKNKDKLESAIVYDRDFNFDYFGFKTLERSYLLKINGKVAERPQHMWMRVAIGIHQTDIESVLETYDLMSEGFFTHATPTLFNAGTRNPNLISCFLLAMKDDSLEGIYDTLKDCAMISKNAGGIGLHIHNVRASGSYIKGTNGTSNGIVPMLKVFNETAKYVDQCFSENTEVYSEDGVKKIKNVELGDKIIDGKGKFSEIKAIRRYSSVGKKLYNISIKHSIESINVTEEHPILVITNQAKMINHDVIKNRIEKNIIKPEYKDAKDLQVGDFVCIPKFSYEKDYDNITEEDARLYGILLGDGHLDDNSWKVSLNKNTNKDTIQFLKNYCTKKIIKFNITEKDNLCIFRANQSENFIFTREMLYDYNKEKRICKNMLFLPHKKSLQIIKGLIETDGHVGNEIQLEMTSENVISNIRFILYRMGILTSGRARNRIGNKSKYKNITSRKITYIVRIPKKKVICDLFNISCGDTFNYFEDNNYYYSRIDKIESTKYKGLVYDFDMSNDPSYLTTIGTAHNGGGRRKGSIAIYLEPWHADIEDFLELKKPNGKEELRARDLFLALWIPDLFMERVEADAEWSLFCPHECPGLSNVYGKEFVELYTKYETEGRQRKKVKAREIWDRIIYSQIETGTPYMLYKDSANEKSNQKNLGTIKSSNLCTEIIEYSESSETACCNLASIALPKYIDEKTGKFDHDSLYEITKTITRNLNRVININYYPIKEAEASNNKHRPIGIGVQGLADVFMKLKLPFDSAEARQLNREIFETIYFASLTASKDLAKKKGAYESFKGSPASKGILQFDMWEDRNVQSQDGKFEIVDRKPVQLSNRWNWEKLKEEIKKHGLRNSLLIAPMPTASTAQILGNVECFEPISSNIYVRRVLSGEFIIVNKYLIEDLIKLNLWNEEMKEKLIRENGSVQNIQEIPENLKQIYRTVWEIPQKSLIEMSADRGAFICQSQSLNLFKVNPSFNELSSMHFYGWKKGLKTGSYYIRTKAAKDPIKFTLKNVSSTLPIASVTVTESQSIPEGKICSIDNPDCESCSS